MLGHQEHGTRRLSVREDLLVANRRVGKSLRCPTGLPQPDANRCPKISHRELPCGQVPVRLSLSRGAPHHGVAAGRATQDQRASDGLGQDVRIQEDDQRFIHWSPNSSASTSGADTRASLSSTLSRNR